MQKSRLLDLNSRLSSASQARGACPFYDGLYVAQPIYLLRTFYSAVNFITLH